MRSSLFGMLVVIVPLAIIGCQNDSGSSGPGFDLGQGCWGCDLNGQQPGSFTADSDGQAVQFRVVFSPEGEAAAGGVSGNPKFTAGGACAGQKKFTWAGTVRGMEMTATMQGKQSRDDRIRVVLKFTDANTATGTFEYVDAPDACLGETGVIKLTRTFPVPL